MSRGAHLIPLANAVAMGRVSRAMPIRHRRVSTSSAPQSKNQVFDVVRNLDQFTTYKLDSSSSRRTLITLWTTSFDPVSGPTSRLLRSIVKSGVGEDEGGVGFCTVELDSADVRRADLGAQYAVTSVPTLLSMVADDAQVKSMVTDPAKLADRKFLEDWIRTEAAKGQDRKDDGGSGSGGGSGGSDAGITGFLIIDGIIESFLP